MNFIKKKLPLLSGIILATLYLGFNLATINDYGVTWDYTYHFNAGLWHLKLPLTDPNFIMGPSAPLPDIFPTLFYLLFYDKWKLLPFDAAYNLYSVFIGSLGILILFLFIKGLFNSQIALFSAITLALLPRYFGHLHNNMKDIPQAVFFTLALWMFWHFYKKFKIQDFFLACFTFALSFNSKINALFILPITAIYTFLSAFITHNEAKKNLYIITYFIFAPIVAFLFWSLFWSNPVDRLIEAKYSYTTSTTNMPLLYFGRIFYSGIDVPWHYPFGLLLVTTPIMVSFFFIIGFLSLSKMIIKKNTNALFVFLWFAIPISRYFKPQMIIVDDVRHFMEILFPFAVISGIGMYYFYHLILPSFTKKRKKIIFVILVIVYTSYLVYQNILYHPYQTSYYSELIGGIKGADNKFDIDFWAGSYKKGMQYLNKNAPSNAKITVAMAPDIAKLYLRSDLWQKLNLQNMTATDSKIYSQSDYTVILNRQSFFQWFNINPYINDRKPVYISTLHDVPLVSIYKN